MKNGLLLSQKAIDALLQARAWIVLIVTGILFTGCFALAAIRRVDVIFDMLYSLFFVCMAMTLLNM